jgi:hypothetical protein
MQSVIHPIFDVQPYDVATPAIAFDWKGIGAICQLQSDKGSIVYGHGLKTRKMSANRINQLTGIKTIARKK